MSRKIDFLLYPADAALYKIESLSWKLVLGEKFIKKGSFSLGEEMCFRNPICLNEGSLFQARRHTDRQSGNPSHFPHKFSERQIDVTTTGKVHTRKLIGTPLEAIRSDLQQDFDSADTVESIDKGRGQEGPAVG